ncbi:sensor domain-containing phosphodiesterase [Salinisphaera hydrothermalis]|uniref:sensor domain-containing phosphodiesterase n=1 Tax=Salinisphaera hydrothermalis TaxID=563188 RepID=UPI0033422FDA
MEENTFLAIQDMIARDMALDDVLVAICRMIESQLAGAMSSVMVFDKSAQLLHLKAGPGLPEAYRVAARQVPVGPDFGICGTAAHRCEIVACPDILEDPRCACFRELAERENLRACTSYPIFGGGDRLLGTFALYYRVPGLPDARHDELIEKVTALTAVAIERCQERRALRESEQRYRSLFTQNPDCVYSLDRQGVFGSANSTACRLTGLSEPALLGRHYSELVVPDDLPTAEAAFQRAVAGDPQHYKVRILNTWGNQLTLDVTNLPILVDGVVEGVYGIAKDVTYREIRETELRILRRSVESATNGIVIADAQNRELPLIYVNEPFLAMTGYTREEVLGCNARFLNGPETDAAVLALVRERLAQQQDVQATLLNYRKDGTTFWNDMFLSPVPSESGEITHYIGMQHDVTGKRNREAQLEYQANHEPVTGLPNRTLLEKCLAAAYEHVGLSGPLLAVLYVDLDDFKPVNDTLGYMVGDELLRRVAHRLGAVISTVDMLASLGGDEFVAVLRGMADELSIVALVEQTLRKLDRPYRIGGHDIHVTASIGIAINNENLRGPVELVHHADMAMYLAKRQGGNTYHWYTPEMTATMNERVVLRRELHKAIEAESFELHYQPLVSATTGGIEGFEALIRWRHLEKGLVSPATFIPLAEQTGQIEAIGEWVIRRACRDIVALNRARGTQYTVAVNISPLQFHLRDFLERLLATLAETGMPADCFAIELTEGVLMENAASAIATLNALREKGIEVSIDDFGTGFSSLSYLKRLPISKVKIDRSFIREIAVQKEDAAIVQGIITMSHHLGLRVVAEGIECDSQYAFLARHGCDVFQGYLFARPMKIGALMSYLDDYAPALGNKWA